MHSLLLRRRLLTVFIAIVVALMINVYVRVYDTMMMKLSCILLIRGPVKSREWTMKFSLDLYHVERAIGRKRREADERKETCSLPY